MRLIYILIAFTFLQSCSSGEDKTTQTTASPAATPPKPANFDNTLSPGKIINVVCKIDSTQSYSLYLPSNYTSAKSWPVFFAFDPHAKGKEPTSKYKELAEKYGYILACSNNSRNNQAADESANVIKTFMADLTNRVNIDNARIYTLGFSGGAKVASGIAILNGGITGVIGSGAGFPEGIKAINNRFYYFGMVGDADFNYGSVIQLDETLQNNNMPHQLLIFQGKHEWPPAEDMEQGFLYMALNAIRDTKAPKNDSLIKTVFPEYIEKEKAFEKAGDTYNAYLETQRIISFFDQLADVSAYRELLTKLSTSADVKKAIEEKGQMLEKESQLQQGYVNDMQSKTLGWWEGEITRLRNAAKAEKDKQQAGLDKRLVAFFGIMSYTNANHAISDNNIPAAAQFVEILNMVDPKNSDVPYLSACILAKKGQPDKALAELKRAISLGYDDKGKMETDPSLEVVRKLPGYAGIWK